MQVNVGFCADATLRIPRRYSDPNHTQIVTWNTAFSGLVSPVRGLPAGQPMLSAPPIPAACSRTTNLTVRQQLPPTRIDHRKNHIRNIGPSCPPVQPLSADKRRNSRLGPPTRRPSRPREEPYNRAVRDVGVPALFPQTAGRGSTPHPDDLGGQPLYGPKSQLLQRTPTCE
jgi:hypothetical protein